MTVPSDKPELQDRIAEAVHGLPVIAPVGVLNGRDSRAVADAAIEALPRPQKPEQPELEDLTVIPDKPHTWGEEWDGDKHQGRICTDCEDFSACYMCDPDDLKRVDCLRVQAGNRNDAKQIAYRAQLARWEAQMDYWRELTGTADE